MRKIKTSPRYVIDIIWNGSALLGGVGGRVNSEKSEKMRYF